MGKLIDKLFLEPCPFCGSECMIVNKFIDDLMLIQCIDNNHSTGKVYDDLKECVDDWNTRYKGDNK